MVVLVFYIFTNSDTLFPVQCFLRAYFYVCDCCVLTPQCNFTCYGDNKVNLMPYVHAEQKKTQHFSCASFCQCKSECQNYEDTQNKYETDDCNDIDDF